MTVFNPLQKRYQKISLVQIDTQKISLNNPNRFIAENDVPLQQITFPCVYLNVTSSNFAHPKLLPGHRLLIMLVTQTSHTGSYCPNNRLLIMSEK